MERARSFLFADSFRRLNKLAVLAALLVSAAALGLEATRVFADPLTANDVRKVGSPLAGVALAEGAAKWQTNDGIVFAMTGVTARSVGGGHHEIPGGAGKITLSADVCVDGCGFAGIALGRGGLSGDFWRNLDLLLYVRAEGCGANMSGESLPITTKPKLVAKSDFNHLELTVDTDAKTVSATVNGTKVLENAPLSAAVASHTLTAAGFRFNEPVTTDAPRIRNYRVELSSFRTTGLELVSPTTGIVTPETPTTLRWRVAWRGQTDKVGYAITDYVGADVGKGVAIFDGDGLLVTSCDLRRGYSEIAFPEAKQTFGILAMEPHEGVPDPFFCIDAGLTWLETRPAARVSLVAALKHAGVAVARERLSLGGVNPTPDKFVWDGGRKQEEMRRLYQEAGVKVLEIMYGSPKHFEPGLNGKHAQNLIELSKSWSAVTEHIGSSWAAYEVNNEPDLDAPPMPADQYVATVKGVAAATDRLTPKHPVIGGVFATVPPNFYFDTCAANGMFDCIDGVSFHQYDRAPAMQGQVQAWRDFLVAHGKIGMPLWLTECGHPWTMGPDRPPLEQDADSAREISAKAIEARACGVASFYPFVLPFYEEGGIKSFSMYGRELTPLRSFAAYAWCTAVLSNHSYCGDLRTSDPSIRRARVFDLGDGQLVAALYTDKVDANLLATLPLKPARITGADGRELKAAADGRVPIPDGLGYVWFAGATAGDAVIADTPAAKLFAASHQPMPARAPASPVVLQFSYSPKLGQISKRAYHLSKAAAAKLPLTVRIQNLSEKPLTVVPTLHLPGADAKSFEHAPLTVPARSIGEARWTVDALAALDVCEVRHLKVTAACAEVQDILPLALPMLVDGELDEILARFPRQERMPVGEVNRWKVRVGHGKQTFSSPDGKGWRMDLEFTRTGDAWAFPYFSMPRPIHPQTDCGIVLRARVAKDAANNMLILVDDDGKLDIRANDLYTADGQWHSVYVPFDQLRYFTPGMQNEPLHLDRVSTLSVGMCSHVLNNSVEVSDLILVGKEK